MFDTQDYAEKLFVGSRTPAEGYEPGDWGKDLEQQIMFHLENEWNGKIIRRKDLSDHLSLFYPTKLVEAKIDELICSEMLFVTYM